MDIYRKASEFHYLIEIKVGVSGGGKIFNAQLASHPIIPIRKLPGVVLLPSLPEIAAYMEQ